MDKLYFKDENEGCYIKRSLTYCDCEGNIQCIEYNEPLPYKQGEEILAPVFMTQALGTKRSYTNVIKGCPKKCGKLLRLDLRYVLQVGDILRGKSEAPLYIIVRRAKRKTAKGHFRVFVKRLDCSQLVENDLVNLEKNTLIRYKGYKD